MTDGFGNYAFLSWLRRGVAAGITRQDASDALQQTHARLDLTVAVRGKDPVAVAQDSHALALLGPGEITGLSPQVVARTWPQPGERNVETNYFPLLEFAQADLPWRYTPAKANDKDRLRPWLCLLAFKEGAEEFSLEPAPTGGRPLPVVTVAGKTSLPKPSQLWAWVHVQIAGQQAWTPSNVADQEALRKLMADEPARLVARLLCPRQLEPKAAYTVVLVPTFQRGCLAGLGRPAADIDKVDALVTSWSDAQAPSRTDPLELPVYFGWRFETADIRGDFEALADLLHGVDPTELANAGVGSRAMDVSDPGAGLPAAAAHPLDVGGALALSGAKPGPWNGRELWVAALRRVVEAPDAEPRPQNAPRQMVVPLYGRWHAQRDTLATQPGTPAWFDELNADPRTRVAAALGTQVVQAQQQQLMASAWRQVEGIRAINAELRLAQLAREAASRLHARHFAAADPEAALAVMAPVHGRVRLADGTVRSALEASPIAPGLLDSAWRRTRAAVAPLGSRRPPTERQPPDILDRANRGRVAPAPAPSTPAGITSPVASGIGQVLSRARSGGLEHRWFVEGDGSGTLPVPNGMRVVGAISREPGRIDLFGDRDGELQHRAFEHDVWSAWQPLGPFSFHRVLSWGPGRLDVFAHDGTGAVHHRWFQGNAWSPSWLPLGETAPHQVVAPRPDRLDLVALDVSGVLNHRAFANGAWSDRVPVGRFSSPELVTLQQGVVSLFAMDQGGKLNWLTLLAAGWSAPEDLGAFVLERVVPLGDIGPAVFARAVEDHPTVRGGRMLWSANPFGELWTWVPLGEFELLEVVSWGPGRVDLFARDGNGLLHRCSYWPNAPTWEPIPGFTFRAALATGAGQLDLVVQGGDRFLRRRRLMGDIWSDWMPVGEFELAAAVSSSEGRLDLVVRSPAVDDSPGPSDRAPREYGAEPDGLPPPPSATIDHQGTHWGAFAEATGELFAQLTPLAPPSPLQTQADLVAVREIVVAALEPKRTIEAGYLQRLRLIPENAWQGGDPLAPAMAAPEFPQPMMEPLRELSQDWLLQGLDKLPANSVALCEPNHAFIEAYMAGLNHEMARELLMNGYPTDLRGTPFRQFWDRSGWIDPATGQRPSDPESLHDIPPMHTWTTKLGDHATILRDMLVLVVRGELLRRYPNAMIYAARGEKVVKVADDGSRTEWRTVKWRKNNNGQPVNPRQVADEDERHPILFGALEPDIYFFGFDLNRAEAAGDPGWFIIFKEQPHAIRFGLDVAVASGENANIGKQATKWAELSWGNLVQSADDLKNLTYIDLDANLPDTSLLYHPTEPNELAWHADRGFRLDPNGPDLDRTGSRAADIAAITVQRPVLVAIPASKLLSLS